MHTFDLPKSKLNMFKHVAMYRRHILSGIITGRGISHMTSMQENIYLLYATPLGPKWVWAKLNNTVHIINPYPFLTPMYNNLGPTWPQ